MTDSDDAALVAAELTPLPDYYADNLSIVPNAFGFVLQFARQVQPSAASPAGIEGLVRVRISPQLAAALKALLEVHLGAYRKQVGDFDMPAVMGPFLEVVQRRLMSDDGEQETENDASTMGGA